MTFYPFAALALAGWIDPVSQYGADPTGTTFSDTAIAAATTASAATGAPIFWRPGTFKISQPIDWRVPGLVSIGSGPQNTKFVQHSNNTQLVRCAGQQQHIAGMQFAYVSQQGSANTKAIGLSFGDNTIGNCFEGVYERLLVQQAQTGLAVDPSCTSNAGLFSCSLHDIRILNGGGSAGIDLRAAAGTGASNCTQCYFENIYIHNNITGSDANWAFRPLNMQGWDEFEFSCLNIEHSQVFSGDVIGLSSVGQASFRGVHFEHLEQSGNPGFGLILAGSNVGNILCDVMTLRFNTFSGTSYNSIFRFTTPGVNVDLRGFNWPNDGGVNPTADVYADFGGETNCAVNISRVAASQTTADSVNAGAGCSVTVT
jgi:hypothetical protein